MTMICKRILHVTRIFVILAFILQNVSAQKENKEQKNKDPETEAPSFSSRPSFLPTAPAPSLVPSPEPSSKPSSSPSAPPTPASSEPPSMIDSSSPSEGLSGAPTEAGSSAPTGAADSKSPTTTPSENPSSRPTLVINDFFWSDAPSVKPAVADNIVVDSAAPSVKPSASSSNAPSISLAPTAADASPAPSVASSGSPSTKPSVADSSAPSTQPSAMDSAEPTVSIEPSTSPPSQFPTNPGDSAPPTMVASMSPSMIPSASPAPSDSSSSSPTKQDTTGLECIDDPAFTNLTPDANGNATDCAWFEYYVFNSCKDFGNWTDSDGNTPNASCCVCGGGIYLDPLEPSSTPSEPPSTPIRCGCRSCTEEIWNKPTGTSSFTCGDRISFLMSASGGGLSEERACYRIGHDEYPEDCNFCTPDFCLLDDPDEHFHCGCPTCTDEAWNRDADGDTCGDRILFLQNELDMERRKACEQVGFLEFPSLCGACDPNTCASTTRSSGGMRVKGRGATWKSMFALPVLAFIWCTRLF